MENYIYEKKHSIPIELCNDIIEMFESEGNNRYEGLTLAGVNKTIKDSLDFSIPKVDTKQNEKWKKIHNFLQMELKENIFKYKDYMSERFSSKFEFFSGVRVFFDEVFQVQRYDKNKGKYIFHDDFTIDFEKKGYRAITYLWYLNDVKQGGETEFVYGIKIKPEAGKLLLFPASWTFPHRGNMPISDNKYIVTGWVYEKIER